MYTGMKEILKANAATDQEFFDESSLKWLGMKVAPSVWGGRYFITSEHRVEDMPKTWTIWCSDDQGIISNVSEFGEYDSYRAAKRAVIELVQKEVQRL